MRKNGLREREREGERERRSGMLSNGWRKGRGWTPSLDLGLLVRGKKKGR
jgi:hypothetical protein